MSKKKLDLFELLNRIDTFDLDYIDSLSDYEKKQVSNYMLLRWMACSNDADKINRLAALPNKCIFNLKPSIGVHLLAACGSGQKDFYKWKKKEGKTGSRPVTSKLLTQYYTMSKADADRDSELMDFASMQEIAEDLGEFDVIPKLRKEFNV